MENILDANLVIQTGTYIQQILFVLLSLLFAGVAFKRRSLTPAASVGAFFLAVALYYTGGPLFLLLLMVFFVSATLLSHFKASIKDPIEAELHAKAGPRDLFQVAANGGAALIMGILFVISQNEVYVMAVAIAFAACNADTWASEIGILSKRAPVSLLTFRPVKRGISGGVSPLGLVASCGGAALIALTFGFYELVTGNAGEFLLFQMGLITLGGFMGSILDSLMGGTIQAKYISLKTGELTEKPTYENKPNALHKGWRFVNNDFVNFASSFLASVLVLFFY
ncbi:DUF92 domain-containing protein [Acetobacterium bakii]|uniref:DUF92 domain-containing protein n=1 Tax=Acetobacterium bakii TaxID=52689 RepID=A0A0L6U3Q1_9FIRM|nr:DUF92 domain-containing protein [Acetobacterium bakii]KNZ43148.1 hypothetical protein AKG39_03105 [Acetobacterium bakii]